MALPKSNLGLGQLLGGLSNQSAQFHRDYLDHRALSSQQMCDELYGAMRQQRQYQQEKLASAFAVNTKLIEDSRTHDEIRYRLETEIARHKRDVEERLMALAYQNGTSGDLTVNGKNSNKIAFTEEPKIRWDSIRKQLQYETDNWLRPVAELCRR